MNRRHTTGLAMAIALPLLTAGGCVRAQRTGYHEHLNNVLVPTATIQPEDSHLDSQPVATADGPRTS